MLEQLLQWDTQWFLAVNNGWHNSFFNSVLPFLRNKLLWIPLYLFLLVFILMNHTNKAIFILLFAGLTIFAADFTSSKIVKPQIERLRPCNNPEVKKNVKLLVHCGQGYSFTSSHATNHFAVAVYLILILKFKISWLLLFWAFSVSISQVYVGVHYPLDILGGAMLGSVIGFIFGKLCLKWIKSHSHQLKKME